LNHIGRFRADIAGIVNVIKVRILTRWQSRIIHHRAENHHHKQLDIHHVGVLVAVHIRELNVRRACGHLIGREGQNNQHRALNIGHIENPITVHIARRLGRSRGAHQEHPQTKQSSEDSPHAATAMFETIGKVVFSSNHFGLPQGFLSSNGSKGLELGHTRAWNLPLRIHEAPLCSARQSQQNTQPRSAL